MFWAVIWGHIKHLFQRITCSPVYVLCLGNDQINRVICNIEYQLNDFETRTKVYNVDSISACRIWR